MDGGITRFNASDWTEFLALLEPKEVRRFERDFLLQRLRADWPEIAGALLAQHSQPIALAENVLHVVCDHSTFANEIALLANALRKKIAAKYGIELTLRTRTSRRIFWHKPTGEKQAVPPKPVREATNPVLDRLLSELAALAQVKRG
ncbi:MAG: DUF721 domain-containing protein [Turneriella sp.]|nr:DUF721 domain-containing protein [Leptospiraceae bacterium]MCX7632198.1 DUF721 domain-containing protein [Turneriella sp.]